VVAKKHEALLATAEQIRAGKILAVKGLGGFHLLVDARNRDAVVRLRERKRRQSKPLALMFPSLEAVKECCAVDAGEEALLTSSEVPIVLLRYHHQHQPMVTELVAPGNPYLGVMLPYTPLHHLLMYELGFPVVATSGNLSDEPICIDEREALERLKGIADLFLVHNRPIFRHVDDSIARIIAGEPVILRRARGYAPLPVVLCDEAPPVLAVGGHLKNSVAVNVGRDVFISQHIGDLETPQAYDAFEKAAESLGKLYDFAPEFIACDLHPDYASTKYAEKSGRTIIRVQHHLAHVLSCMAENGLDDTVLGVAWDGTGYGLDGTVWGGEFIIVEPDRLNAAGDGVVRFAHFRRFRLPGGDQAVVEPRRAALGLLYELYGDDVTRLDLPPVAEFSRSELEVILSMLKRGFNSPLTSSVGRLFDAIASITGIRQMVEFEGQAAMELEFAALQSECSEFYEFTIDRHSAGRNAVDRTFILNWEKMINSVIDEVKNGVSTSLIARKVHNTLLRMIASVAELADIKNVVLSGGCFQNKILLEGAIDRLREMDYKPYWHHQIPTNDGGIAVGQASAAAKFLGRRS
jgi:hydrogenase maturation protein HypF